MVVVRPPFPAGVQWSIPLESRWLTVAAIPGGGDVVGMAEDNVRQKPPRARMLRIEECMFGFAGGSKTNVVKFVDEMVLEKGE